MVSVYEGVRTTTSLRQVAVGAFPPEKCNFIVFLPKRTILSQINAVATRLSFY